MVCSDEAGYVDEADVFFADPTKFISEHYTTMAPPPPLNNSVLECDRAHGFTLRDVCMDEPDSWQLPTHIVMYDALWPQVEGFLATANYTEVRVDTDAGGSVGFGCMVRTLEGSTWPRTAY